MSKCIIMCAGEFSPIGIAREKDDLVIAADNGLTYLCEMGICPDLILGDFDSLAGTGKAALDKMQLSDPGRIIRLPVEKDDTDTMAALREGLKRGYKEFEIYAALGGRLDHTFANLQALKFLAENGARGTICSKDCTVFLIHNETKSFEKGLEGTFSLFALDTEIRGVTIRGMKYETDHITITNAFPIGESNELLSDQQAVVTVENGTALAIVSR